MPGTTNRLLPNASRTKMAAYDIVCLHTMVGTLDGTDGYFRRLTTGVNSHFGTSGAGKIYQWVDTAFRSGANMNGNHRVISVENADIGPEFPAWNTNDGGAVPAFTPAQIEVNAQIIAWAHRTHGIPIELIPDSKPGRRGIGYHRQGVPGFAVAGGELWSASRGKVCPGNRRIAQIPAIIARARAIVGQSATTTAATFPVSGSIRAAYDRKVLGDATWAFFLGAPKGPEVPTVDKVGRWQEFLKGAILWHPNVDKGNAHVVWGLILQKFWALGAETRCGYPITDEKATPDTVGRYNHFSHPDGFSIYSHPSSGTHSIQGAIRAKWAALGWEVGFGYPTTDEVKSGRGAYNQFTGDRGIYWTPEHGAHPVSGEIRKAWGAQGWENGPWGFPTADPVKDGDVVTQTFEGGVARFDSSPEVVFEAKG